MAVCEIQWYVDLASPLPLTTPDRVYTCTRAHRMWRSPVDGIDLFPCGCRWMGAAILFSRWECLLLMRNPLPPFPPPSL